MNNSSYESNTQKSKLSIDNVNNQIYRQQRDLKANIISNKKAVSDQDSQKSNNSAGQQIENIKEANLTEFTDTNNNPENKGTRTWPKFFYDCLCGIPAFVFGILNWLYNSILGVCTKKEEKNQENNQQKIFTEREQSKNQDVQQSFTL